MKILTIHLTIFTQKTFTLLTVIKGGLSNSEKDSASQTTSSSSKEVRKKDRTPTDPYHLAVQLHLCCWLQVHEAKLNDVAYLCLQPSSQKVLVALVSPSLILIRLCGLLRSPTISLLSPASPVSSGTSGPSLKFYLDQDHALHLRALIETSLSLENTQMVGEFLLASKIVISF